MKLEVLEIGDMVSEFLDEHIVILFGPSAPKELREISVIHDMKIGSDKVFVEGKKMKFGETEYEIKKVGGDAEKTFQELGHVSLYFKEGDILPGSIELYPHISPANIIAGGYIEIY